MWDSSWDRSTFQITMPHNTPLGACKFTATGRGTNKQTLTLTTTVTVKSATTTVLKLGCQPKIVCDPLVVTYGDEQVELMSVKVLPEFPAPTPTGKVTISEGKDNPPLCVITLLSGKGSCGLTSKELKKAGTYHIVATYGGSLTVRRLVCQGDPHRRQVRAGRFVAPPIAV